MTNLIRHTESFRIGFVDMVNKYIDLQYVPYYTDSINIRLFGAPHDTMFEMGKHFIITSTEQHGDADTYRRISWDSMGFDGLLVINDLMNIRYVCEVSTPHVSMFNPNGNYAFVIDGTYAGLSNEGLFVQYPESSGTLITGRSFDGIIGTNGSSSNDSTSNLSDYPAYDPIPHEMDDKQLLEAITAAPQPEQSRWDLLEI